MNKKNPNVSKKTSYIVTDNGTKVYFEVNGALVEDTEYSEVDDRCFEKEKGEDYSTIWISEDYSTITDYMADMKDTADRMKNDSEYNNVKLSEIKTKTVNGIQFTYRTLDYNIEDTEFHDLQIAYEIAEESLYTVEIEQYQLLNDSELNGLLNITIEK